MFRSAWRWLLVMALAGVGCSSGERSRLPPAPAPRRSPAPAPPSPIPIYSKWFDAYAKETGVRINYQSIGSGGGIRQFTEGTVDFGATDGPMTDQQIAAVHGDVLHVPTVLGAVVATYNLPGLGKQAAAVRRPDAGRHLPRPHHPAGTTRGSPALNPGVDPARDRHPRGAPLGRLRDDASSSPTSSPRCRPSGSPRSGSATSVEWPVGLGGKGNEGVTQQVKQSEGAIGYVELIYALSQRSAGRRDAERGRPVHRADAQGR